MDFNLTPYLEIFLQPPSGPLILIVVGLIWRKRMTIFVTLGALSLYFCSIPATTRLLSHYLELYPVLDAKNADVEAIVVLGSKLYRNAPEYGYDTPANLGLERIRYAARLHRQIDVPILVSGGTAKNDTLSEAQAMKTALELEFGAAVNWVESNSRSTFENGQNSARILKNEGIQRIALVTHAYHMPRAVEVFQKQQLTVTAAPTMFFISGDRGMDFIDWLPSSSALYKNRLGIHEIIGRWYYHFLYYSD